MPTKIINPPNTSTYTPIQIQVQAFANRCNTMYASVGLLFQQLAEFLYGRPTPQAAFDAFGTSAADLLVLMDAYAALVLVYTGVTLSSPIPTGATITKNSDGTVTYTPAPPQ